MKYAGFSTIELLVTLAIAVILASMAAPSFNTMMSNYRLSAERSSLVADLQFARTEALRRSGNVSVCQSSNGTSCGSPSAGWAGGRIVFVDTGTAGSVDGSDTVLRVTAPSTGGVTIAANGISGRFIQYDTAGVVTTSGTLTVCRVGYRGFVVAVQPVGRISTTNMTVNCS